MIFISGPFYYIKEHLKKYKFSSIDENSNDRLERAINALSSFNLFSNEYVLIENVDKWSKKDRSVLLNYLNDTTIITSSGVDKREKFFKEVLNKAKEKFIFTDLKPWETDKWMKFIISIGKKHNLKIGKGIAFEILKTVGEDYDRIDSELKKISSVKTGAISIDDLKYISTSTIDFTNFIVDKIMLKQRPFNEIDSFFKFKMQPLSLVYSLMRSYRTLLIIKDNVKKQRLNWNDISVWSKKLKIGSGTLSKFVGFSFSKNTQSADYRKLYSINQLYKILEKLIELESNMKLFDDKSHFTIFIEYLNNEL